MIRELKISGLLFFVWISVFGQGNHNPEQKKLNKALYLFNLDEPTQATDRKALTAFSELADLQINSKTYANIAALASQKAGILLQMNGSTYQAQKAYEKSIRLSEKYQLSDSLYFRSLLYLGGLYYSEFSFDSSYVYLSRAEQLFTQNSLLPEAARLFNILGVLYYETGDYRQSILYFMKAIELRERGDADDYALKVNLALAHHQLSDSKKALQIYRELESSFPKEQELLINMAAIYLDLNEINKAEETINKIDQSGSKELEYLLFKVKGELEFKKQNYSKALAFFRKSVEGNNSPKGPVIGDLWMNLGQVYYQTGQYEESLSYFQKAIIALSTDFNETEITQNPKRFLESYSSFLLMKALASKANVFNTKYELNSNSAYGQNAADSYEAALSMASVLSKKYNNEASRIDFTQRIHDYYTAYTDLLLAMGDIDKAFRISDRGKAAVLSVSLSESNLSQIIPDSLLRKERLLTMRQSALMRKQSDTNQDLGKEISEVQLLLSQIKRKISNASGFIEIGEKHLTVEEVKAQLGNKEAFLSFYEGKSKSGVFIFTKTDFEYHELGDTQELRELKNRLSFLSSFEKTDRLVAYNLYHKIIYPLQSLIDNKKMLIISTDGVFHGVPFEVFLDKKNQFLVEKWAVEYIFNASFLGPSKAFDTKKVLAIAPFAEKNDLLLKWFLPTSALEVASLKGDKLLNSEAQKRTFLERSSQYGIIHLSTHAKAHKTNTDLSYIQFYPSQDSISSTRLYLHEMHTGSLNGPLVFLSACETYGEDMIAGEGIRGLCYGFAKAGASGIISSLWNAEDHSTTAISQLFYQFLDKGYTAPVALQKAKVAFLNDPSFVRFHHPSYWAHLVYTGHQAYHSTFFTKRFLYYLLATLFLFSGYLVLKKRR